MEVVFREKLEREIELWYVLVLISETSLDGRVYYRDQNEETKPT